MPLRRVAGLSAAVCSRFCRGLSTSAASRPERAMIYDAPLAGSSASRTSLKLVEPPCDSRLLVPARLVDPRPGPNANSDNMHRINGGFVQATSGDGLLLLDLVDVGSVDPFSGNPEILRFVCNPLSGEMFRLPDVCGTKNVPTKYSHGLLTHSARRHGPPDRYVVADLKVLADHYADEVIFMMRRFLSQTGSWDELVCSQRPRALLLDRGMNVNHEILAFAGRLWLVDVSWGTLSFDPFSDRPDLRFFKLPRDSVTDPMDVEELIRYRRMGVSEGRLRYVEVTREEPFVLSSFALDNDTGSWTLNHQMALSRLWMSGLRPPRKEDTPQIAVVDPLNASVIHITISNVAFAVDMNKGKVLGCSTSTIGDNDGSKGNPWFSKPCVFPPWLESSPIPSAGTLPSCKASVKSNTLSDILVRVDRSKEN